MKSVGEVMAIGRSFTEAVQKACQSLENNAIGLGYYGKSLMHAEELLEYIKTPKWDGIFSIKDALMAGISVGTISKATNGIDRWFLYEIQKICNMEKELAKYKMSTLPEELLRDAKSMGFSDDQICHIMNNGTEDELYEKRKALGITRVFKMVDTCSAEFAAKTPYFYSTFEGGHSNESKVSDKKEIIEHEKPEGVIVQLGGQTALKLAERLHQKGIRIIGTSYDSMDIAEDRGRFSDMLKELDIPYPDYGTAWDVDDAIEVANKVGYPVLVRPSYVLGGQRMRIVINDEEVEKAVVSLLKHLPGNKILIDHFLDRCQEAEVDAIFDGENFHVMGVMEHIEPAGIHSGDSHAVLPVFNLTPLVVTTMEHYAEKIARNLNIKGLINIQYAIKDGKVYVIEANPRASRTTPFIAKAYQIPYLNIATKVMMGSHKLTDFTFEKKLNGFAIKEPVFSFNKFPGVRKELGPQMKSTAEPIRFIKTLRDPYFRQLYKDRSMYLSK